MANQNGTGKRKRYRPLRYFFLNGELHKSLRINRPGDLIEAWAYTSARRVSYVYTDVKKNMQKAFTTPQVAAMLSRNRITIDRALDAGDIPRPQFSYVLEDPDRKPVRYYWREEDIMGLHAVLADRPAGRIARDGSYTRQDLLSARELRAMIRNNVILYVKTDEGFVPTWQAEQF